TAKRGVLPSPANLYLAEDRLVLVAAPSARQEMKLVAVATGAVAGAGVARIDPERHSVGAAQLVTAPLGQLLFAFDLQLQSQAELVPGQPNIGEVFSFIHGREVFDPAGLQQIEQA